MSMVKSAVEGAATKSFSTGCLLSSSSARPARGSRKRISVTGLKGLGKAPTRAVALAGLGQSDRITEIEAQLDEIGKTRYVSHFTRATIALARNDREAALDSIEASRDQGEYESVIVMEVLDIFAPLRDHPRYRRHLELMGIPERVSADGSS